MAFFYLRGFIKIIIRGEYLYRNSPVDPVASAFRLLFLAAKMSAKTTISGGFTYALANELDEYLVNSNKKRVFVPAIHTIAKKTGINIIVESALDKLADIVPNADISGTTSTEEDNALETISRKYDIPKDVIIQRIEGVSGNQSETLAKALKSDPLKKIN